MRWTGNKQVKESFTDDGYHLKAEYVEESKYWWIVYKDGKILDRAVVEQHYMNTLESAKAKARYAMIRDLRKNQA